MRCPACGSPALADDARFCIGCGAPFPDEPPDAEEPLAATPEPLDELASLLADLADDGSGRDRRAPDTPIPPRTDAAPVEAPEPIEPPVEPPVERPRFEPREVPAPPPRERAPRAPRATAPPVRDLAPLRDPEPTVPVPVVIGGVVVLLTILLLLLLAS